MITSIYYLSRGCKHFLILVTLCAINSVSWKFCILVPIHTITVSHSAEFWASVTNNITTFSILKLGTFLTATAGAWLDLRLLLVLADFWLVCVPSWAGSILSTSSKLVDGTCLELSSRPQNKTSMFKCSWKQEFSVLSYSPNCRPAMFLFCDAVFSHLKSPNCVN